MRYEPVQMVRFNKISVNLIETNSGIFVGNISANGWHSNNKSNNGFGSSSNSSLESSINMVIDNDGIDTVISDYNFSKDFCALKDMKVNQSIYYDAINVNSQSIASAINTGENDLRNWRSHSKINKGFGNAAGINHYSHVINENIDQDIIDTFVDDTSLVNFNEGYHSDDEIHSFNAKDENSQQEKDNSSDQKK